ncbi:MAG: NAD(P)-binding oxidoreductase [Salibacteraceae bacterium]
MYTLVVGASGATGKHLVEELIVMGHQVKVMVRPAAVFPDSWTENKNVSIIEANVSEIDQTEMAMYLKNCNAVASCLGHNMTFKGIFGKPRKLVKDTIRLLSKAIELNAPTTPVKLVLMNTAGNINRDLPESVSPAERIVLGLIRALLPPHLDNEHAADFLRTDIGQDHPLVEWVVVRPDTLIDQDTKSEYDLHASPTRSALFNPGKTSRINVGYFMAKLLSDSDLWNKWKGQMPVIYNK